MCDRTLTLKTTAKTCKDHKNCNICDFEENQKEFSLTNSDNFNETCLVCDAGFYQFGLTDTCFRECDSEYHDWTVTCEAEKNDVSCKFELTSGVCY